MSFAAMTANRARYPRLPVSPIKGTAVRKVAPVHRVPVVKATPRPIAAPVATPTPPTAIPVDYNYDASMGGLARDQATTLSGLAGQRTSGLLDYGYTEGAGGLAFDPNNPFSRAALLQKHFKDVGQGTGLAYAARGQAFSGAAQTAQDSLGRAQSQSNDALSKGLAAFLAKNTSGQVAAKNAYDTGAAVAGATRITNAATNPNYTPSPVAPTSAVKPTTKAGVDSKGNKGSWHTWPNGRKVFVRA